MNFRKKAIKIELSLRSKLVISGMLILLIPMTVVGIVSFTETARTLETISSFRLINLVNDLSEMIRISLRKDQAKLTAIATDGQVIRDTAAGDFTSTQKKLSTLYLLLASEFEGLAVYDSKGIIQADGVDVARIGISIAERNYYKAAKFGKSGIGPMVHSKATGAPIFGMSAPILSPEGAFIGGVLGVVKAEYLTHYIANIKCGETGHLFMVDQYGTLIAHPDKEKILVDNISDIAELAPLASKTVANRAEAIEYAAGGYESIASICTVPPTGWRIGAVQHKNEIMRLAYTNMRFLLIVSVIFIVLVVLAVIFFSKTISVPVQNTLNTLNHAIEQSTEAFFTLGEDARIIFANAATADIFDQPLDDIAGKKLQPLIGTDIVPDNIEHTLKNRSRWSGQIAGTRQNGERRTLVLTLTPIFGRTKKLMYFLATGRDITKELSMREQLMQSQKMEAIGTLAGGIAHDFNNILSGIYGYTDLAFIHVDNKKKLKNNLNQIMTSAQRAKDLVGHILTFSRKTTVDQERVIPKYTVKDTVQLLRASLPTTIEIRTSLKSSASVLANTTQIHQMVMNLGTNAGYEMRETGGTLNITLDETVVGADFSPRDSNLDALRHLRITVADTGGGIPPEIQDRIFDPFFTTKPTGEGTGLGLSVVHGIAKSLGGNIFVSSKMGEGTTFTIVLPIEDSRYSSPKIRQTYPPPRGTEWILLVDDEELITLSMKALMERHGYHVCVHHSGKEALEAFKNSPERFDIIVTDYTMPQMTGVAFAKKVRALRSNIPIILCSGHLSFEKDLGELAPIEYLKKPVTAKALSDTIQKLLEDTRAHNSITAGIG